MIGVKPIYDATAPYAGQGQALATTEVADDAIQNAIDGEFVCVDTYTNIQVEEGDTATAYEPYRNLYISQNQQ